MNIRTIVYSLLMVRGASYRGARNSNNGKNTFRKTTRARAVVWPRARETVRPGESNIVVDGETEGRGERRDP